MSLKHLMEDCVEEPTLAQGEFAYLAQLATLLQEAEDCVAKLETELKTAKEHYNKLSMEIIPDFMGNYSIPFIGLPDGRTVKVIEDLSVSLRKDKSEQFAEFLASRGELSLAKSTLVLDKQDIETVDAIRQLLHKEFGMYPEISVTVHSQTLKKWAKEVTGLHEKSSLSEDDARYIPLANLPESLTAFVYRKTIIK